MIDSIAFSDHQHLIPAALEFIGHASDLRSISTGFEPIHQWLKVRRSNSGQCQQWENANFLCDTEQLDDRCPMELQIKMARIEQEKMRHQRQIEFVCREGKRGE